MRASTATALQSRLAYRARPAHLLTVSEAITRSALERKGAERISDDVQNASACQGRVGAESARRQMRVRAPSHSGYAGGPEQVIEEMR